ncbi:MAG: preprotein translocase subunit SecY [Planctomycetota bacterium]|jgi:preprotein translocase subunit SecY
MLESFSNIVKVPELKKKLIITGLLLMVFRFGSYIPVPGIDVQSVQNLIKTMQAEGATSGKLLSMADLFSGGAIARGAIFSLGIMPYITASIIFQLLCGIIPALERLQREGAAGRKKISQYTRIATLFLVMFQSAVIASTLLGQREANPANSLLAPVEAVSNAGFYFYCISSITIGTLFLMWLGEQIDEFGIGNGISLLIMAGIIARLPGALAMLAGDLNIGGIGATGTLGLHHVFVLILLFVGMIVSVVLITLGQRRIPVNQAKATRGRRVYGGARSYLPLKVNQSGVIPIIFAQSLLMLPPFVLGMISKSLTGYFAWGSFWYMVTYVLLIIFFCYFYTAVTFNPNEMSDNLKQGGSYIPGIRPGKRTADYLERIMTRIALAGAIFLSFVAVVPTFVSRALGIRMEIASFLGGTGLLIVVGVALDLVQRVENHLLQRNYEGFVKGGKTIRGRR